MSSSTFIPTSIPIPLQEPIAEAKTTNPLRGFITFSWIQWLTSIAQSISLTATAVGGANISDQSASVPATDLASSVLSAGLYEVKWYARITQAATVSSSLTVTIDWTEDGGAQSYTAPAITGNTTTTKQPDIQLFLPIDGASPVRYTLTYASVGATPMKFKFAAVLSAVAGT